MWKSFVSGYSQPLSDERVSVCLVLTDHHWIDSHSLQACQKEFLTLYHDLLWHSIKQDMVLYKVFISNMLAMEGSSKMFGSKRHGGSLLGIKLVSASKNYIFS